MWILIEDGDIFEGNEEQLDDCFGIGVEELARWCFSNNWKYKIIDSEELLSTTSH